MVSLRHPVYSKSVHYSIFKMFIVQVQLLIVHEQFETLWSSIGTKLGVSNLTC